jgi:hypothetical protein
MKKRKEGRHIIRDEKGESEKGQDCATLTSFCSGDVHYKPDDWKRILSCLNITLALTYLLFIVLFQHLLNRNMVNSNYVSEKEIATSDILYIKCLPTESVSVPDAWIPDSTITLPSRHINPPPPLLVSAISYELLLTSKS